VLVQLHLLYESFPRNQRNLENQTEMCHSSWKFVCTDLKSFSDVDSANFLGILFHCLLHERDFYIRNCECSCCICLGIKKTQEVTRLTYRGHLCWSQTQPWREEVLSQCHSKDMPEHLCSLHCTPQVLLAQIKRYWMN